MPGKRTGYHAHESKRTALRHRAWAVYPHVCWLCHRPIDSITDMDLDHVTPLSKGGDDFDLDGVRLAHRRCNRSRGNRPPKNTTPPPKGSRTW